MEKHKTVGQRFDRWTTRSCMGIRVISLDLDSDKYVTDLQSDLLDGYFDQLVKDGQKPILINSVEFNDQNLSFCQEVQKKYGNFEDTWLTYARVSYHLTTDNWTNDPAGIWIALMLDW
jgi:hypothetical protein